MIYRSNGFQEKANPQCWCCELSPARRLLLLVEGRQEDTSLCLVRFLSPWALKYTHLPSFIIPSKSHLEAPLLEMAEAKVTELSTE